MPLYPRTIWDWKYKCGRLLFTLQGHVLQFDPNEQKQLHSFVLFLKDLFTICHGILFFFFFFPKQAHFCFSPSVAANSLLSISKSCCWRQAQSLPKAACRRRAWFCRALHLGVALPTGYFWGFWYHCTTHAIIFLPWVNVDRSWLWWPPTGRPRAVPNCGVTPSAHTAGILPPHWTPGAPGKSRKLLYSFHGNIMFSLLQTFKLLFSNYSLVSKSKYYQWLLKQHDLR